MAAIEAASGTSITRSTTVGTKLGSTRGRPMPSIREPLAVTVGSPSRQPRANAEFSGSTRHSWVAWACSRRYRPRVALVPPVPAPTTIQAGTGWGSRVSWPNRDSAMLLLPRQSVARSA